MYIHTTSSNIEVWWDIYNNTYYIRQTNVKLKCKNYVIIKRSGLLSGGLLSGWPFVLIFNVKLK